ncbi:MAG: nucleotide-binding protein [Ignavibacteria bacterium]|nr:nucleotide-binding protein [Ignavibacteria bacterium]
MESLVESLENIIAKLSTISEELQNIKFKSPLEKLLIQAEEIGLSFSGSYFGYHSRVYYKDLMIPPPGARFSIEWGFNQDFLGQGTVGDWYEYDFDKVISLIKKKAGNPDLKYQNEQSSKAKEIFVECKDDLESILKTYLQSNSKDDFIKSKIEEIKEQKIFYFEDFVKSNFPNGKFLSRDTIALQQGIQCPPHISIISNVSTLFQPLQACKNLMEISKSSRNHIRRNNTFLTTERKNKMPDKQLTKGKIFIGHGNSLVWNHLKDFIEKRLNLEWDEFNRIPTAGFATKERLEQMLNESSFAFIIMTAEDEQKDNLMRARMNVIHEVGLFQGRLGFKKAIVLLEEGCEEFSNIVGLGQIRFPKGKIKAAFEEIRETLEREGLIS